ncbi:hypothetical protein NC653_036471 [Populus alba x Populus x berolinensis]|uniref:O-fucosyltransferase family protein n=1 Tax=Populus alba x Populus x berolinensis TaxID=444605 RepID=A0AAD6LJV9_9ROSI|nr:hypothetical protein NC653_036471 [Populus alba x Populus x berolinensis]
MVATAHIINATLVVPKLDKKSYWQDLGNFIPQVLFYFSCVKFITKLPKEIDTSMKKLKYFKS